MTDQEIAKDIQLTHISSIAEKLGLSVDDIDMYGKYKAKLSQSIINPQNIEKSNLILVTAISPTPAGEGKTTMSIGLSEGLNQLGKQTTVVLREPSLGPVFGIKGGATGGGYSQVLPMEDINLHLPETFLPLKRHTIYYQQLLTIIFKVKQILLVLILELLHGNVLWI